MSRQVIQDGISTPMPDHQPGIEGDYDEIIAWMREHPVQGLQYAVAPTRAVSPDLQFGLFSLIYATTGKGRWVCEFSRPLPPALEGSFPGTQPLKDLPPCP